MTNELPQIRDASGALASRFVILTLTESFYGREDRGLADRLMAELPGILNWSLRGLDRLQERSRFVMPKASRDAVKQMEELGSPIRAFIDECCELSIKHSVLTSELYDEWKIWCEANGHRVTANNTFGKDLRAAFPSLSYSGAGDSRKYVGIGVK